MFTRLKIVSLCFSFVGCSIGLGFPEHASAQSSRAARPAITQGTSVRERLYLAPSRSGMKS